jgi:hypothetical protein
MKETHAPGAVDPYLSICADSLQIDTRTPAKWSDPGFKSVAAFGKEFQRIPNDAQSTKPRTRRSPTKTHQAMDGQRRLQGNARLM